MDETSHVKWLAKLSATRWTVRADCFRNVIENYLQLHDLWYSCLQKSLQADVKAWIIGCKTQMKILFGLQLARRLYSFTDNLSGTLQKEKMAAISGKWLADLTTKTFQSMRND